MTTRRAIALALTAVLLVATTAGGRAALRHDRATAQPTLVATGLSELALRDTQITVWLQALHADSTSALALGQLAGLHAQRAREGGGWDDYLRAEEYARRSLGRRLSRNGKTAATLASVLLAQHRFSEARETAESLARREPDVPEYRALLGEAAMEQGDYRAAESALETLWSARASLSIAPRLARWAELTGRPRTARRMLDEARAGAVARRDVARETKAWFHLRAGDLALRQGRHRTAAREYDAGLAIEPGDARLLSARARLAALDGAPRNAIAWGERAVAAQLDPATLGVLADAHAAIGDTARAEDYVRALEAVVTTQPGPWHRASSLFLLDHGMRVGEVLERARQETRVRRDIHGWDLLAWALHRNGSHRAALRASDEAVRLGTPDALLWYHRGAIARVLGRRAEAESSLTRALDIDGRFHPTQARDARAMLDSLRAGL